MSHGHGKMERYVLAVLSEHSECGVQKMLALHPEAAKRSWRSLQSSLNRALRNLQAEKQIFRVEYNPGDKGWREYGGCGFSFSGQDRKATAYHEAGHAVIARSLGVGVKLATIKPSKDSAGCVFLKYHDALKNEKSNLEKGIIIDFAGPLAELELYTDKHNPRHPDRFVPRKEIARGAHADRKQIRTAVPRIVAQRANDGNLYAFGFDIRPMRAKLKREAMRLVREHKSAIERVARALIERETLTGADVALLIGRFS